VRKNRGGKCQFSSAHLQGEREMDGGKRGEVSVRKGNVGVVA